MAKQMKEIVCIKISSDGTGLAADPVVHCDYIANDSVMTELMQAKGFDSAELTGADLTKLTDFYAVMKSLAETDAGV